MQFTNENFPAISDSINENQGHIYDIAIIGAGLAGYAASIYASNRGLSVVQTGETSELSYATGLIDLFGSDHANNKSFLKNPWSGIENLRKSEPDHPYSKASDSEIETALSEFIEFMKTAGINYTINKKKNSGILTPIGTVKPSYCVPESMYSGTKSLEENLPCIIFDFHRLKGFSAKQICETLKEQWPNLSPVTINFPGLDYAGEITAETMARALDMPENRKKLASEINKYSQDAKAAGLPAIIGLYSSVEAIKDLEEMTGLKLFEIPTMSPSVAGLRLKEAFGKELENKGVKQFRQSRVTSVRQNIQGNFLLDIDSGITTRTIEAKGVILAGGRFFSKGLISGNSKIVEPLFNLPVFQPVSRSDWFKTNFFAPSGHNINKAGITTDSHFRPLNEFKIPAYKNLFAAGSILAHQDWKRSKCGGGIALSSALCAVRSFMNENSSTSAHVKIYENNSEHFCKTA